MLERSALHSQPIELDPEVGVAIAEVVGMIVHLGHGNRMRFPTGSAAEPEGLRAGVLGQSGDSAPGASATIYVQRTPGDKRARPGKKHDDASDICLGVSDATHGTPCDSCLEQGMVRAA